MGRGETGFKKNATCAEGGYVAFPRLSQCVASLSGEVGISDGNPSPPDWAGRIRRGGNILSGP